MQTDQDLPSTDPTQIAHSRERLRSRSLDEQDWQLLDRLLGSFLTLIDLLQRKNATIKRLKRWLFGPTFEKRASAEQKPPVSERHHYLKASRHTSITQQQTLRSLVRDALVWIVTQK